ncbi:unnamed protein product [Cyprideis torosa]|uniref:Carboxylic ester hydrolase n=1 Tax=Cyprideis torosa TaxID=163714 RepID=A0A7R8W7G2_9CRUS|nr:unnamed protein product [Cyprideis torosa]CAG0882418.1 unnamed protein product [Cyprideis torosa]
MSSLETIMTTFCILVVAVSALAPPGYADNPVVEVVEGAIRGTREVSAGGSDYFAFYNIPYAKPPLGPNRFKAPVPVDSYDGVIDGTKDQLISCLQLDVIVTLSLSGKEDCLVANVYTKTMDKNANLPVIVWIHGGGYLSGSGSSQIYKPGYLMDKDIVVVAFNYRLGIFGFLSTEDSELPGNYGLMDQIELLKWVQRNIRSFGGDPNSVTIMGHSAGAGSVSLLTLSPLADGLFHKAIAQSGAATCPWVNVPNKVEGARIIAKTFNCSSTSSSEIRECLIKQDGRALVASMKETWQKFGFFPLYFTPRVDKESSTPVLPKNPTEILESGEFQARPFLNGITEDEGTIVVFEALLNAQKLEAIRQGWESVCPILFVSGDRWFKVCQMETANAYSKWADTFFYKYSYNDGSHRKFMSLILSGPRKAQLNGQTVPTELLGVGHGDELFHLFNGVFPISETETDALRTRDTLLDLWTSFAATGTPTLDGESLWPKWSEENPKFLNFEKTGYAVKTGFPMPRSRFEFWEDRTGKDC